MNCTPKICFLGRLKSSSSDLCTAKRGWGFFISVWGFFPGLLSLSKSSFFWKCQDEAFSIRKESKQMQSCWCSSGSHWVAKTVWVAALQSYVLDLTIWCPLAGLHLLWCLMVCYLDEFLLCVRRSTENWSMGDFRAAHRPVCGGEYYGWATYAKTGILQKLGWMQSGYQNASALSQHDFFHLNL